jgi:NhaP-type Na+/H+ or K+/H+ antiporter
VTALLAIGVVAVLYAMVAARLDRWSIGAPLVFVTTGVLVELAVADSSTIALDSELVQLVTETTLALLLFADASTIGLRDLKRDAMVPTRLLLIGLPLTIAAGAVAAMVLLDSSNWAVAALVAAILAPTDAALSLAVVSNKAVPVRIRRALNVESGLNDGIATPIVAVLVAVVIAEESSGRWIGNAFRAVAVALAVAAVVGLAGGWLTRLATRRGLMTRTSHELTVLLLALLSYLAAVSLDGNGFVAAFVAGLLFGSSTSQQLHEATEFTETVGLFLSFAVWAIFGMLLVGPLLSTPWDWRPIVYAVCSLTVVRMLPVALALAGSGLAGPTRWFIGWFGPRGLASVVFFIIASDQLNPDLVASVPGQAVVWTILLSVIGHGLTAGPLAARYGTWINRLEPPPIELEPAPEPRLRRRHVAPDPVQRLPRTPQH